MTEKQINDLAETLANRVIEKIEVKQKEWDEEFEKNMQQQQDAGGITTWATSFPNIDRWENNEHKFIDLKTIAAEEKLRLQEELKEHREILLRALDAEEYEHCRIIERKITKIHADLIEIKKKLKK